MAFDGQTVLITGGNSGLGYETARQCLILGAKRVIIAVRSVTKGEVAVKELKDDPSVQEANSKAAIEVFELDLDDYQSTIRFAERVKRDVSELDVLLCNAGTTMGDYEVSLSGHERVMQVNCYSHFLLTLELLPLLRATAHTRQTPSRLTMVGSYSQDGHSLTEKPIPDGTSVIDHLDNPAIHIRFRQYQNSKLIMNAFVQHLATLIPATDVIANVVCPGVLDTNFFDDLPLWLQAIMFVWRKTLGRSAQDGSDSLIYAMRGVGVDSHGKFISEGQITCGAPLLDGADGEAFTRRVWTDVCADLNKVAPNLQLLTVDGSQS